MQAYVRVTALVAAFGLATGLMADDSERLLRKAQRSFAPLPAAMPGAENDTPALIELGKKLYFDPRLSINDRQSCATCHPVGPGLAGMDSLPTSPGAEAGKLGVRNSPTVLNAGWQKVQFWDGRAKDLEDQAGQPILNPVEMGMPSADAVVDKLRATQDYPKAFADVFANDAEPITYPNLSRALAAFERTFRTEARFDDFLQGDTKALNEAEQRGLATFMKVNCVRCHDGPLLGGTMLEKLGVYGDFPSKDEGRFEVTADEKDRKVFKVAQLRNVALTGPWFHNGSVADLDEAVRTMAKLQLNHELKDNEVADIVSFLKALNGKELEQNP